VERAPDPLLLSFLADTRPLLAAVRAGLADLLSDGPGAVGRYLRRNPVDAAVRLADAWALAAAAGLPLGEALDRLPPADRLVVNLVTAVRTAARPSDPEPDVLPELVRLVDAAGRAG
jgi:hypothetical protein